MNANADSGAENLVTIEVDGRPCQAPAGTMLIEVTDAAGASVPRFCYHRKLSVAANCRMCLVEVENVPKPLPACATPVTDGMRVFTASPMAREAQRGTMEFLLINHPLDCPICDQGGECELQDLALGYGRDISRFTEKKRVVQDKDIGPLVATDMTRCIHCTRCVRFGDEIAGVRELGATGRGEHMEIGTFIETHLDSELSGNIIDLCPVGALTSKPFRFRARAWELEQRDSVAPHDCAGSNLHIHVRRDQVMRVVPRENEDINESWISDRDRFSYEGLYHDDRLGAPMVKRQGVWKETDWEGALQAVADGVRKVLGEHGPEQLGALFSPALTLEELYLGQRLIRALGSGNIDHRLRQNDFRDQDAAPAFPSLGQRLADLEQLDAALLVGSNIRKDQPILSHRLRKATLRGASVMVLNPVDYDFVFPVTARLIASPARMVDDLAAVLCALCRSTGAEISTSLRDVVNGGTVSATHESMAKTLLDGDRSTILLGNVAMAHPDAALLRSLAAEIARVGDAILGYLPEAGNSTGAWLAGALPHRGAADEAHAIAGSDARRMITGSLRAYLLMGIDPDLDCWDARETTKALTGAQFVVSLSPYRSDLLESVADVLLPITPFTETSGTWVNGEGTWQSVAAAVSPWQESRPGWKVLRVLGNLLGVEGFDYVTSEQVRDEVKGKSAAAQLDNMPASLYCGERNLSGPGLVRVGDVPIYALDPLVRRANALQHAADAVKAEVRICSAVAERLGLKDGDSVATSQGGAMATLHVTVDERVADGCAWIPSGVPGSEGLGAAIGPIDIDASAGMSGTDV